MQTHKATGATKGSGGMRSESSGRTHRQNLRKRKNHGRVCKTVTTKDGKFVMYTGSHGAWVQA